MKFAALSLETIFVLTVATLVFATLLSLFQFIVERKAIYLYSLIYWSSILVSSFVNLLIEDKESLLYLLASTGTFMSNAILALVMLKIKEVPFSFIPSLIVYLFGHGTFIVLRHLGFNYETYAYFMLFSSAFPIFYAFYKGISLSKSRFSSGQKLFFISALLLGLHYCDYPYFKARPELFSLAMILALLLIFAMATLMPLVTNEFELYLRNLNLEAEVTNRLKQLREKDMQMWDTEKYTSIGRISGVLAHELNTPLASISSAASLIQRYCGENRLEDTLIAKNASLIRKASFHLSTITESLKKASGDQLGLNQTSIGINQFLKQLEQSITDLARAKEINCTFQLCDNEFLVDGNLSELEHAIRLGILFLTVDFPAPLNREIQLTIRCDEQGRKLTLSNFTPGTKMSDSIVPTVHESARLSLENSSEFSLVVIKSILQANNADIKVKTLYGFTDLDFIFSPRLG